MPTRKLEKVVSLKEIKVACQECSLNEICLPVGIGQDDLGRLDSIIDRKRPLTLAMIADLHEMQGGL